MRKLGIAAIVAAFMSTSAMAAGIEGLETTVGAERNTETEVNSIYSSVGYGVVSVTTTLEDTAADNFKFNLSTVEIDVEQPLGGTGVSVYMNNDFDSDFKHSSTVVGAKFTF